MTENRCIYKKLVAMKRFGKNLAPAPQQEATTIDDEVEQPVTPVPVPLPENCPRCSNKLPPPLKSSGRTVCRCGWTDKPIKQSS
jgi:hypothetical protein